MGFTWELTRTPGNFQSPNVSGCVVGGRHVNWDEDKDVTLHTALPIVTVTSDSLHAKFR